MAKSNADVLGTGEVSSKLIAQVKVPFVRSPYNYDMMAASNEAGLDTGPESMTQQQFKDECDINVIVRRFGLTGELPENPRVPMYGDFTEVKDYRTALEAVMAADDAFLEFPAELRARFENDPQKLLEFCENGANREEAVRLGLIKAATPPVEPVAPSASQVATPPA